MTEAVLEALENRQQASGDSEIPDAAVGEGLVPSRDPGYMTGERATAGVGTAEENSDAHVGDGLPDVPLYGAAGGKTRAVEDAGPYDAGTGAARNGPPRASAPTKETGEAQEPDPGIMNHLRSLQEQAEELKREFPDFDLDAALHDPAFLRLTAPALGVGVREAFYALNRPRLDELAAARAAEASKALLARAVSGGAQRPREGGGSGAAALLRSDYAALSRPRQLALKQRIREAAARGEKMYP